MTKEGKTVTENIKEDTEEIFTKLEKNVDNQNCFNYKKEEIVNSNKLNKKDKILKEWEREKRLIPVMIRTYCKGNHKKERKQERIIKKDVCKDCKKLTEYALFRLEKCPFKVNKKFCSFCKIHCYEPEMKLKIKQVMKYSGPRMLFTHPIYAVSHVVQMIKYKKEQKNK